MLTNKRYLIAGLFVFIPLFSMQPEDVLRRARGNSVAVEITLKKLDSPVESASHSPEPLTPQELGCFYHEFEDSMEFSDRENDQELVLELVEREKPKPTTKVKLSEADTCLNWREAPRAHPRPENPFPDAQRPGSPRKKSSSRPTNISRVSHASTEPLVTIQQPKPRDLSKQTVQLRREAAHKTEYAVWTPPTSTKDQPPLAVVATAATLHSKQLGSNNPFAHLSEQESN